MGLFAVLEVTGPVTSKIELPQVMKKAHKVFHLSRWKLFHRRKGDEGSIPVVIDTEGNVEQEFIAILDKKKENRSVFYLVQFEGDSVEDAVWMKATHLDKCKEFIKKFKTYLQKNSSKGEWL